MSQYKAISILKFNLFKHRLRSVPGVMNWIAGLIFIGFGIFMSLFMAAMCGTLSYLSTHSDKWDKPHPGFNLIFWIVFVLGILLPVMAGVREEGFDLKKLLVFPVKPLKLFSLQLGSYFTDATNILFYPTMIAVLLTSINSGIAGFFLKLLIIVFFTITMVLLTGALVSFIHGFMRNRKLRELAAIAGFLLIIIVSFIPVTVTHFAGKLKGVEVKNNLPFFDEILICLKCLPPTLSGNGYGELAVGNLPGSMIYISGMAFWTAFSLFLAWIVFRKYTSGEPITSSSVKAESIRIEKARLLSFNTFSLSFLSEDTTMFFLKEITYLSRSAMGKFNLIALFIFAGFFSAVFAKKSTGSFMGMEFSQLLFYGLLIYVVMFINNFASNCFAWESTGIKNYFTGPVNFMRLFLGKNIAVWCYSFLLLLITLAIWSVLKGLPGITTVITALFAYSFTAISLTGFGNLISTMFPQGREISSMMKSSPSQFGMMLSLINMAICASIIITVLVILTLTGLTWLQPIIMLALLAIEIAIYPTLLKTAAELMGKRREKLIDSIANMD